MSDIWKCIILSRLACNIINQAKVMIWSFESKRDVASLLCFKAYQKKETDTLNLDKKKNVNVSFRIQILYLIAQKRCY